MVMKKYIKIIQYQVIQKSSIRFHINVVAKKHYLNEIHQDLLRALQEKFPKPISFAIIPVEQIKPDASGKIKTLISEIG